MPKRNKYENASLTSRFAEGESISFPSTYQPQNQFVKMIVLDVINDPNNIVDENKIDYWKAVLNVSNIKYANSLPRNSIIGVEIGDDSDPIFLFPFFPSHLSMPCKPGEVVWALIDEPESRDQGMVYWMCKVAQPHHVDDVNHTHEPRKTDPSFFPGTIKKSQNEQPKYELRNGTVQVDEGFRITSAMNAYIVGKKFGEDIFEKLVLESDAGRISQWEAVPRFRKRPGDIALEGSNNTLIVLGTDRTGPPAVYQTPPEGFDGDIYDIAKIPTYSLSDISGSAGSIDLVAGRGQTPTTGGGVVDTTSIVDVTTQKSGSTIKKELDKFNLVPDEGDPDLRNDRSRVQISQRTRPDSNFGLSSYNQKYKIADSATGDAAVVIKTDKMRIIARSDVEIVVTGYAEQTTPPSEIPIKNQSDDLQTWASIVIKSNGDVIFTPSKKGYIKLGGDDADRAIVCTDYSVTKTSVDGQVKAVGPLGPVLVTNDGASFGSGATNQGSVATKILVK